jgi:DNA-directed RNA polymerase specialized sigma24 family protein
MNGPDLDKANAFEHFIDLYCPSIYSAIARLTGLTDKKEIENLTVSVFMDLWKNSQELFNETRPPALVYKILLLHVFSYLKKEGYEDRIVMLQNTLPIDPAHYTPILESEKEELKVALYRRLISLLKR